MVDIIPQMRLFDECYFENLKYRIFFLGKDDVLKYTSRLEQDLKKVNPSSKDTICIDLFSRGLKNSTAASVPPGRL